MSYTQFKYKHTSVGMSSGRGTTVMSALTRKRPSALLTSAVEGGFWGGRSPSQKPTGTARRQARRARQEPDALRFEREIRVFPALARQSLSTSAPTTLMRMMASLWDLWRGAIAERNKSHSLAAGTRSGPVLPARGRFERLFEQQKDFQVWRGKSGQY